MLVGMLLAIPSTGSRPGRHRHAARQRDRRERRGGARSDRHRHRNANQHQPDRRHQRGRQLHLLEPQNGTYSVEAELQGFRKVIRQNVSVDVNTTMRVDLKLELGQVTEAVTVVGRNARSCRRTAPTPAASSNPRS